MVDYQGCPEYWEGGRREELFAFHVVILHQNELQNNFRYSSHKTEGYTVLTGHQTGQSTQHRLDITALPRKDFSTVILENYTF